MIILRRPGPLFRSLKRVHAGIFMLACPHFNEQNKRPSLLSIITWSVLGKQNVQAEKVYCFPIHFLCLTTLQKYKVIYVLERKKVIFYCSRNFHIRHMYSPEMLTRKSRFRALCDKYRCTVGSTVMTAIGEFICN